MQSINDTVDKTDMSLSKTPAESIKSNISRQSNRSRKSNKSKISRRSQPSKQNRESDASIRAKLERLDESAILELEEVYGKELIKKFQCSQHLSRHCKFFVI